MTFDLFFNTGVNENKRLTVKKIDCLIFNFYFLPIFYVNFY